MSTARSKTLSITGPVILIGLLGFLSCEKKPGQRPINDIPPCEVFAETAPPQHLVQCGERVRFRMHVPIDSLKSIPQDGQDSSWTYFTMINPNYRLCGADGFNITLVFRSKNKEVPFKPDDLFSFTIHQFMGGGEEVYTTDCYNVMGYSPHIRYNSSALMDYMGVQPSPDSTAYYHTFTGAADCPAYKLHCLKAEADSILLYQYIRFVSHAVGGQHETALAELKAAVDSIFFINEVTLIAEDAP